MYNRGGGVLRSPLENRYRVEMHVCRPIFQGQVSETLFGLEEGGKYDITWGEGLETRFLVNNLIYITEHKYF